MTENTPRVSSSRLPFWTRFAIVVLAIAAACLGLVTLHSTTSHSHSGVSGAHSHSEIVASETTLLSDSGDSNETSGFLATCDSCALGTVAGAAGAAMLLLLLAAVTSLTQNPAAFARLLERGRVVMTSAHTPPRRATPPPLALGISRT